MNSRVHMTTSVLPAIFTGVAAALTLDDTGAGVLAAVGCVASVTLSTDFDQLVVSDRAHRVLDEVKG